MDDLALYHVNFLNYKESSGILHILQAAILADYYDEVRMELASVVGEELVAQVEQDYATALNTIKSYV